MTLGCYSAITWSSHIFSTQTTLFCVAHYTALNTILAGTIHLCKRLYFTLCFCFVIAFTANAKV